MTQEVGFREAFWPLYGMGEAEPSTFTNIALRVGFALLAAGVSWLLYANAPDKGGFVNDTMRLLLGIEAPYMTLSGIQFAFHLKVMLGSILARVASTLQMHSSFALQQACQVSVVGPLCSFLVFTLWLAAVLELHKVTVVFLGGVQVKLELMQGGQEMHL